jgi:hypothetical protein
MLLEYKEGLEKGRTKSSGTTRAYLHGDGFWGSHPHDALAEKLEAHQHRGRDTQSNEHRCVGSPSRVMVGLLFALINREFELAVFLDKVLKTAHLQHNQYIK